MVDIDKTLCKQCGECRDYLYRRIDRKGNLIEFQYCEGNKEYVDLSEWYIQKDGYVYSTRHIKDGRKTFFHTLFKKNNANVIDHIDGYRTDNRLMKLREITPTCNSQNIHLTKVTSKFPGVYFNRKRGKYIANIHKGKGGRLGMFCCGAFDSEYEAYDAYVKTLRSLGMTVNTQIPAYKDYIRWLHRTKQTTLV